MTDKPKIFNVTLLKGYSHTDKNGSFFQNRTRPCALDEETVRRYRSMENGTKFKVIEKPPATPPPAPVARDTGEGGTGEAAGADGDSEPPVEDDEPEDDEPEDDEPEDEDDVMSMTVKELKSFLDEHGVDYPSAATKSDLQDLAATVS